MYPERRLCWTESENREVDRAGPMARARATDVCDSPCTLPRLDLGADAVMNMKIAPEAVSGSGEGGTNN
jgi:hypothetical protein